jgi:NAD(P)H-hydrate epimerase
VRTIDADAYSGDAGKNLRIIEQMGIETMDLDAFLGTQPHPSVSLIVDALFGTGLGRAIEGRVGEVVTWINTTKSRVGSRVLAVDTPSGLDAQSGLPMGSFVVRADRTVTFAGLKPGMSRMEAIEFLGEVHVAPIGVPIELLEELGQRIESRNPR